ncbi:MAG: DUF4124 domain-containing protein [Burkholderiales bacterium]|nr:DUF4124 domain-containing protein [Burkholderiales bacterium]
MKRISVAIALALCVALPASAQLYKWVDSNGKVHYSDKPPPGNVKMQTLREPAHPPSAPAAGDAKGETKTDAGETKADTAKAGPKTLAEQEQAFRKRQAEAAKAQEEAAKKEAKARDRAENCKNAKAALAGLELGGRQSRINEKGERVFLSDQQISQETAKARQDVAEACK